MKTSDKAPKPHAATPPEPPAAHPPKPKAPRIDPPAWVPGQAVVVEDIGSGRRHALVQIVSSVGAHWVRTLHGEDWRRKDGVKKGTKSQHGTTQIRPELPEEAVLRHSTEVAVTVANASWSELRRGLAARVREILGVGNGRV